MESGTAWVWPRPWVATASDLVSKLPQGALRQIFAELGEEPKAELCASAIVHWRGQGRNRRRIRSTLELRHVIDRAISAYEGTLPAHVLRNPGKRRKLSLNKTEQWISTKDRRKAIKQMTQSKPWNTAALSRCF